MSVPGRLHYCWGQRTPLPQPGGAAEPFTVAYGTQMETPTWTIPWQLVRAVCSAIAKTVGWFPLTQFAWRIRFVVAAVAVAQAVADGRIAAGVVVAVFIALTYLAPWWHRQWEMRSQDDADRFVARPRTRGRARPVPSPVPARAADTRAPSPPDPSRRPPAFGSRGQEPDAKGSGMMWAAVGQDPSKTSAVCLRLLDPPPVPPWSFDTRYPGLQVVVVALD